MDRYDSNRNSVPLYSIRELPEPVSALDVTTTHQGHQNRGVLYDQVNENDFYPEYEWHRYRLMSGLGVSDSYLSVVNPTQLLVDDVSKLPKLPDSKVNEVKSEKSNYNFRQPLYLSKYNSVSNSYLSDKRKPRTSSFRSRSSTGVSNFTNQSLYRKSFNSYTRMPNNKGSNLTISPSRFTRYSTSRSEPYSSYTDTPNNSRLTISPSQFTNYTTSQSGIQPLNQGARTSNIAYSRLTISPSQFTNDSTSISEMLASRLGAGVSNISRSRLTITPSQFTNISRSRAASVACSSIASFKSIPLRFRRSGHHRLKWCDQLLSVPLQYDYRLTSQRYSHHSRLVGSRRRLHNNRKTPRVTRSYQHLG